MKNAITTDELLKVYYDGLAKKSDWDSVISDDFKFVGGDMTKTTPVVGKPAYLEVIKRFSRLFTNVRIKEVIVNDDKAFVQANYDYLFPDNVKMNGDVAEVWKVKDGKLDALTIFFDTLAFQKLTKP